MKRETNKEHEIRLRQEHIDRVNSSVRPEREGIVRSDGPRRQVVGKVLNDGSIHWTEI